MPSYIVVVSPSYGGAEKRFFDILTGLRRGGDDVRLIAPSSLVDRLRQDHADRGDVLEALIPVPMPRWGPAAFALRFRRLLRTLPRGSHFHYPINCLWPLHLGRGDRVTLSMVDCTRVPSLFGGTLNSAWTWLAFFAVDRIDVLNPAMLGAMRAYRRAPVMSLTPGGTFMVPPPDTAMAKAPTVVLLGRLVPGKGVDEVLGVLPRTWQLLRDTQACDCSFQIAGYGAMEAQVHARVESLRAAGVPVCFVGYAAANALLAGAAVVLSMQDTTNYPSRVVAEGLMMGCGVIVRDTGDSREFGSDLPGLEYCKARLDAEELALLIARLIRQVLTMAGFSARVREAARQRFSSLAYINYFRRLIVAAP